ncbi:MAG: SpoIID/LytB domain-containing protein [Abditibacteriota bacterium]|nr:SpoIID/LytB domain-containing protein [Abditibacteriota bacterium]
MLRRLTVWLPILVLALAAAAAVAAAPALPGAGSDAYTVPVKLTCLPAGGYTLKTISSCKGMLADTRRDIPAGSQISFVPSGELVLARINGQEFKQTAAELTGKFAWGDSRIYAGTLRIRCSKGRLSGVCVTDLEDYTAGVLACEIGALAPAEALKAMAVAVRTYAVCRAAKTELCDSSHCQNFRGVTENPKLTGAAAATAGQLMLCKGVPIEAMYSADCGGVTEQGNAPYLKSKKEPSDMKGHRSWTYVYPKSKLSALLGLGTITRITVAECTPSGRIRTLVVYDGDADKTVRISGDNLRSRLGYANLKSTFFTVAVIEKDVVFSGKGYGHGKGLCQAGITELAGRGWDHKRILAWYYDGIVITDIGTYKQAAGRK